MIGTKFYKPLQDDLLTKYREVETTNSATGEIEKIQESYTEPNPAPNTLAKYTEASRWCNENKAFIEDKGDYYEVVALPEPTSEEKQAQALAQAKQERAKEISKITIEVDGMIFDGDEDSQTRMSRTITASQAMGLPEDTTISWAMADTNPKKVEQVTVKHLAQALYLAGLKQSELWVKPYGVEQTATSQTGLEYLNSLGQ